MAATYFDEFSYNNRTIVGSTNKITVTSAVPGTGDINTIIDGSKSNAYYFASGSTGNILTFDFGSTHTGNIILTEARWFQDVNNTHGTWQWEGSDDGTSYTNIGATFILGGTAQVHTTLNSNTTGYRYYRLRQISGNASNAPYIQEVEFKIGRVTGGARQITELPTVLVDPVENISTVSNVELDVAIKPDTVVNTSIVNVASVSFRIRPANLIDGDTVTNIFKVVPGPISVGVDTVVDPTDIVNNITVRFRIRPNSVLNQNIVSTVAAAVDQEISVGVLVNNSAINDVIVVGRNEPAVIIQDEIYRPINNIVPQAERTFTTDANSVFKDLSLSFIAHPLTGAATVVSNYASINQGLRNLFLTDRFERPFSSLEVAGKIREKLFDLQYSDSDIKTDIEQTIANYEPRISLINVDVKTEMHTLEVAITYKIKTFDRQETLSLFLERS